jgi:hypothetical protein
VSGDKRDSDRVPVPGDLRGEVMIFQPMAVQEIRVAGAQVETPFPSNSIPFTTSASRSANAPSSSKGESPTAGSRTSIDLVRYRSGIEFVEPSEPVAAAIADYVTALKSFRLGV